MFHPKGFGKSWLFSNVEEFEQKIGWNPCWCHHWKSNSLSSTCKKYNKKNPNEEFQEDTSVGNSGNWFYCSKNYLDMALFTRHNNSHIISFISPSVLLLVLLQTI